MFERIKYPDGQISAKWNPPEGGMSVIDNVIKERINSYEDLFYVRSIADVAKIKSSIRWKLFIPCMFGQRSDRRFERFQSFDLKLITDVINECNFGTVEIFDPHSDVTMALINNSIKRSSFEFVKNAVQDLYRPETGINTCNFTLVSPDAGAYKKVFDYGEKLNLPVVAAVKHRDTEGKIDLTFMGDVKDKHCLIVDDLCDGGYTFELLAKALRDMKARKVYLYVSHGLFSKGFAGMYDAGIDGIYCTNSIKDLTGPYAIKVRTSEDMYPENAFLDNYVTQYKVI